MKTTNNTDDGGEKEKLKEKLDARKASRNPVKRTLEKLAARKAKTHEKK